MSADERTRQLARLLGLPREADSTRAAEAAADATERLAAALAAEAAENDDVTSAAAALDYLELRLRFFGELIPPEVGEAVRRHFAELVASWERIGPQGAEPPGRC